jgi:phage tail sheath protein FI
MAEKIISPNVFVRESDKSLVSRGPVVTGAAIVGPTVKGRPLVPTVVTSYSEYQSVFGETFKSGSQYYEYFTSLAAKEYFSGGGNSLLVTRIISGSAYNTYAQAYVPFSGSTVNVAASASFTLEVKNYGTDANNSGSMSVSGALATGSSVNVRWEVTNTDFTKGTFTLIVRRGDDVNQNKNILETWSNLSLDPQQPNFISRQIGDEKPVYVAAAGTEAAYVQLTGSFAGGSQYVRVASIATLHADSFDNEGVFKATTYSGSLPNPGSGSIGGAFAGGIAATNRTASFFDAINTAATDAQGFIDTEYVTALNLLTNKDEYDFNLLLAPGMFLGANALISDSSAISTVEGRGDSFAIKDLVAYGDTKANAISAAAASTSNYGAGYWPWVQIQSANLGRPVWVPPSVVMAGVYAFNDNVGAEWFAPAGLNRGGIGSVIRAEKRLSATDRDDLYAANVNPLATFPGEGVVAFGQKTFQKRATSLDRINVRRLLINLKRFVSSVSRQLVFEQNTTVTRNRFLSVVNPYMEQIVSKQGLYAYKVIMDDTNNTADVIDRNQLVGQIYVQPTKTAEFIILDFTLQPTGATFPA